MNQLHMKIQETNSIVHLPGETFDRGVSFTGALPSASGVLGEINGAFG